VSFSEGVLEALLTLAFLSVVGAAYALRAHTLSRRGAAVPIARRALFAAGLVVLAAALLPPFATYAEGDLFSAHMGQHLLLGDIAPALLLAGLTGALLRPVLAALPAVGAVRAVLRPWPGLAVALALVVAWHVPVVFDAAVRHEPLHVLEHVSFVLAGILVWLPVLETLPGAPSFGAGAKLGFVLAWRLGQTVLGNILLWAPDPLYAAYGGVGALEDQRVAAALMMGEGTVVFLGLAVWLGVCVLRDAERRQSMVEAGVHPRVAERAVRYGR
jgi:putative membrane protein